MKEEREEEATTDKETSVADAVAAVFIRAGWYFLS